MPAELEQSKKILAERDKVIADAQHHADGMVAQAKDYIAKLTEESELVRQAQERANQVIQTANDSSEQLKNSSITYAGDVLKYVESTLEKTLSKHSAESRKPAEEQWTSGYAGSAVMMAYEVLSLVRQGLFFHVDDRRYYERNCIPR